MINPAIIYIFFSLAFSIASFDTLILLLDLIQLMNTNCHVLMSECVEILHHFVSTDKRTKESERQMKKTQDTEREKQAKKGKDHPTFSVGK